MPTLPLPLGDTDLGGGDLPVTTGADVLAEFPQPQRNAEVAPVRDAFCETFALGFLEYQNAAAQAAAQIDMLRATGLHLRAIAEARTVAVGRSDDDETLRARILATPEIVTPEAIYAAINEVLAPRTDKTCQVSELNLDGYFVHAGTSVWDSFIGSEPNYPDRYYEDVPESLPGGAVPSSGRPRSFAIRVPSLAGSNNLFTYASSNPETFAGDGSDTAGSETSGALGYFTYADSKTSDDLYDTIVSVVNAIKGQGITWSLLVDDRL